MKTALYVIGIAAALTLAACGDDNPTPTPAPAPTPTPSTMPMADMATAPAPTPTPTPTFPTTAAVTVGPGSSLTFAPQNVDVAAGGTVTWTWGGTLPHSVTSDSGLFDSGVKQTGTFSFTFPTAGTFTYFCTVHGRNVMFGSVVVH
jgi:plastocyanin